MPNEIVYHGDGQTVLGLFLVDVNMQTVQLAIPLTALACFVDYYDTEVAETRSPSKCITCLCTGTYYVPVVLLMALLNALFQQ